MRMRYLDLRYCPHAMFTIAAQEKVRSSLQDALDRNSWQYDMWTI